MAPTMKPPYPPTTPVPTTDSTLDPSQSYIPPVLMEAANAQPSGTADLESRVAGSPDAAMADLENRVPDATALGVVARSTQATPDESVPTEAPKEGKTKSFLKQLFGFEQPEGNAKGILGLLSRGGNALQAASGSPKDRAEAQEFTEKQQELASNERLRQAQMANTAAYQRGMLGINQQKADTGSQNADTNADRAKTYADLGGSRQANLDADTAMKQLMVQGQVPVDAEMGFLWNRPDLVGKTVPLKLAEAFNNGPGKAKGITIRDFGMDGDQPGQGLWAIDKVGNPIHQLSHLSPQKALMEERAKSLGQQRFVPAMGPEGNAVWMTGPQAVASGAGVPTANIAINKQALQTWQPALDSGERYQIMKQNYADGLKGDQQAMLSLLANHLGMTMGLQKGARLNQAIISEAEKSQPWIAGIKAKFDDRGYLSGVTLGPEQMRQMMDLAGQRYLADVQKARYEAQFLGIGEEPQLPINPETGVNNAAPPTGATGRAKLGGGSTPAKIPSYKEWLAGHK